MDEPGGADRIGVERAGVLRRDAAAGTDPGMDFPVTLALALAFAALTLFCGWRGARPLNIVKGPRLMPWRMLMLLSATGCILMLVHLANLGGLQTGSRIGRP